MKVGFFYPHGVGDTLMTFKALYAIKHIYKAEIIYFGKKNVKALMQNCDFIDEFVEIPCEHDIEKVPQNTREEIKRKINMYNLDYIVSPHPRTSLINFLKSTNAKKIIVRSRIASIFSLKCKSVPISSIKKKLKKIGKCLSPEDYKIAHARRIKPKLFDKGIKNLHFDIKIKTKAEHKARIDEFLKFIKHSENMIVFNPFSIAAAQRYGFDLEMKDYLDLLALIVEKFPNSAIIIITYETVHKDFVRELETFFHKVPGQIHIFQNDDDLLNACELLKRAKVLLSPSTGLIHLASNLRIPSIGIFSYGDTIEWKTYNEDYVILPNKVAELSPQEMKEIKMTILERLESYLA